MTEAIKLVEKFLNELSPDEAVKAMDHIRGMILGQSINIVRKFVDEFDHDDPIDGIISSSVAHIITHSLKLLRDRIEEIKETKDHMCSLDLATIMISVFRGMANGMEKQLETEKHTH